MQSVVSAIVTGDFSKNAETIAEMRTSTPKCVAPTLLLLELEEKLRKPPTETKGISTSLIAIERSAQKLPSQLVRDSYDARMASEVGQLLSLRFTLIRGIHDLLQPSSPAQAEARPSNMSGTRTTGGPQSTRTTGAACCFAYDDLDWGVMERTVSHLQPQNFRPDILPDERKRLDTLFAYQRGSVSLLPVIRDLIKSLTSKDPLGALAVVARGKKAIETCKALLKNVDRPIVKGCPIYQTLADWFWTLWGRASIFFYSLTFATKGVMAPAAEQCWAQVKADQEAVAKVPKKEEKQAASGKGFFSRLFSKKTVEPPPVEGPVKIEFPPADSMYGAGLFPELVARGCTQTATSLHSILSIKSRDVNETVFMVYFHADKDSECSFFGSQFSLCSDYSGEVRRGGKQDWIQCMALPGYSCPTAALKNELLGEMAVFFATSVHCGDVTKVVKAAHDHLYFIEQTQLEGRRLYFVLACLVPEGELPSASSSPASNQNTRASLATDAGPASIKRTPQEQNEHAELFSQVARSQISTRVFECFDKLTEALTDRSDHQRNLWSIVA